MARKNGYVTLMFYYFAISVLLFKMNLKNLTIIIFQRYDGNR